MPEFYSQYCVSCLQEKLFLEKLNENHESSLRRQSDSHREKIALMERQFLQQKQQVSSSPLNKYLSSS